MLGRSIAVTGRVIDRVIVGDTWRRDPGTGITRFAADRDQRLARQREALAAL